MPDHYDTLAYQLGDVPMTTPDACPQCGDDIIPDDGCRCVCSQCDETREYCTCPDGFRLEP